MQFFSRSGEPLEAPRDWEEALVAVDVPASAWQSVRLQVRGRECLPKLTFLNDVERVLVDWPRVGPGNYHVRLTSSLGTEETVISILPSKIGRAEYGGLIEDLESTLPASLAMGLQRMGALAGVKTVSYQPEVTFAQEIQRIRMAVFGTSRRPGLAAVLGRIGKDPFTALASESSWVGRASVRRPTATQAIEALSRSGNLDQEGRPIRVLDARVSQNADVLENRLIKLFCHQVDLRLQQVVRVAEARALRTQLGELEGLSRALRAARAAASFLEEVSFPNYAPTRASMHLARNPNYRAALEGFLDFRKTATVRFSDTCLEAPLENWPFIYQSWGVMQVLQALLEQAARLGYRVKHQSLVSRDQSGLYVRVLPGGKVAVELIQPETGAWVAFVPQRSYGTEGRFRSVSFKQIPDVTVEIRLPQTSPRMYVFDPKYRLDSEAVDTCSAVGVPKKLDIDKMHAYRDAIRDEGNRSVVEYAAILYPGPYRTFGDSIQALPARPSTVSELRGRLGTVFAKALASPPTA